MRHERAGPEYVADIERRIAWMKGDGPLTEQAIRRDEPLSTADLPLFAT